MSLHSFDPRIAHQVGVNAAVIYQNLVFWAEKNKANQRHIRDGYVWTYNSARAFSELFPYLSQSQVKTAINKLVESGLLVKGEYNKANYDRTNWYSPAITAEWVNHAIGQKSPMDQTKIANGLVKNRQPIPDSKPVYKPDKKYIGQFFSAFWEMYPRKVSKGSAEKAFAKALKLARPDDIMFGLSQQLPSMTAKEKQFIPHAATWLNAKGWENEIEPTSTNQTNSQQKADAQFDETRERALRIGGTRKAPDTIGF